MMTPPPPQTPQNRSSRSASNNNQNQNTSSYRTRSSSPASSHRHPDASGPSIQHRWPTKLAAHSMAIALTIIVPQNNSNTWPPVPSAAANSKSSTTIFDIHLNRFYTTCASAKITIQSKLEDDDVVRWHIADEWESTTTNWTASASENQWLRSGAY